MYTPPNPVRRGTQIASSGSSLSELATFYKMGIITKEELRSKVLQWNPSPAQDSPAQVSPAPICIQPKKRKGASRFNKKSDGAMEEEGQSKKKSRPGRPEAGISTLRKLVKDPTRRRFFNQCCDPHSVLWQKNDNGIDVMNKMLFAKAAQDPMDLIYRCNPGATREVQTAQMQDVINWQVYKDRQNWLGKTPKRRVVYGDELFFDWEGELQKLRNAHHCKSTARMVNVKRESKPKIEIATINNDSPTVNNNVIDTAIIPSIDLDLMVTCCTCGVAVWIGSEEEVPPATLLAHPPDSDWTTGNAEPFCPSCWEKETQQLEAMGAAAYKSIGPKVGKQKTTTKDKDEAAAKKKADAAAKKKADAAAKKKADAAKKMKYKVNRVHIIPYNGVFQHHH